MARVCALPTITDDSALGGAVIEKSLRFNRSDNPQLQRTAQTTSNTFTFSTWVKRSSLSTFQYLLSIGGQGLLFNTDDTIRVYTDSGANASTAKFRDVTSWYHVVLSMNSGSATVYVNNVTHLSSVSGFSLSTSTNYLKVGWLLGDPGQFNLDGYLAETQLIDGSALTPSSFGYTESQTNIWMPKRYEGTYGTSGFYLNYSTLGETATTMGLDRSGNNNNFTPTNLEISDFTLDTPSNTFATLNPLSTSVNTLSQGNLYSTGGGASWRPVVSDMAMSSGRWYWEIYIDTVSSYQMHGIRPQIRDDGDVNHDNDQYPGTRSDEWGYNTDARLHNSASATSSWGDTYTAGDIIGVALDMDAGTLNFYKNGSATGSQITGISASHSPVGSRGDYLACFCVYGSTGQAIVNFGQEGTFAGHKTAQNNTDINGIGNFFYTPPTGFKALCSANLRGDSSYIIEPQKHFDILTYTGNDASDRTITGLEFKPDLVWIKNRDQGDWHIFTDSVRGANTHMYPNNTDGDSTDNTNGHVNYYTTGGFNVDCGAQGNVNENNEDYVAWCWKGGGNSNTYNIDGTGYGTASAAGLDGGTITPTGASINTKARFSIIGYTGNGSGGSTVEHGLGVVPTFMIIKKRTGDNWMTYHQGANNFSNPQNYYFELNSNSGDIGSTSIFMWTVAPTSSVFSLGADSSVNKNNNTYISYCWGEVPGYSKFGTYRGNSSSSNGSYIHLGFRPALIIIKKFSGNDSWQMHDSARQDYNNKSAALFPSSADAEQTSGRLIDFLSNGFKFYNADGNTNEDGHDYVYFAWAERAGQTPYGTFPNAR